MSKENFKNFVKNNPNLVNYVKNNEMTWQKFYELYDLYGEDKNIWDKYLNQGNNVETPITFKSIFDLFKGVDLKAVQKTLTGLDKAIGTFREFSDTSNTANLKTDYELRPTDRYYED